MASGSRALRWLNFIFFILNVVFVYIASTGAFGNTNDAIADKHPSLLSLPKWSFLIWVVIFALEAIMSIAQLFKTVIPDEVVVRGLSLWWILSCIFQIAWAIVFSNDLIRVSMGLLFLDLLCFMFMMHNFHNLRSTYYRGVKSFMNFASVLFVLIPISLHYGWMLSVNAVSASLTATTIQSTTESHRIAIAIISCAILFAFAFSHSLIVKSPDPFTVLAIGWAFFGISEKLIEDTSTLYSETTKSSFQYTSRVLAIISFVLAGLGLLRGIFKYLFYGKSIRNSENARRDHLPNYAQ